MAYQSTMTCVLETACTVLCTLS